MINNSLDSLAQLSGRYKNFGIRSDTANLHNSGVYMSGIFDIQADSDIFVFFESKPGNYLNVLFRKDTATIAMKTIPFRRVTFSDGTNWFVTGRFHVAGFKAGEPMLGWYKEKSYIARASDGSLIIKKEVNGFGLIFLIWPLFFYAEEILKFDTLD